MIIVSVVIIVFDHRKPWHTICPNILRLDHHGPSVLGMLAFNTITVSPTWLSMGLAHESFIVDITYPTILNMVINMVIIETQLVFSI